MRYQKLGGFKQWQCRYALIVLVTRRLDSVLAKAVFSLKEVEKNLSSSLLASGGSLAAFGIPWLTAP